MAWFLPSREVTIAIDLGTRNFLISDQQKILLRQQTLAAHLANDDVKHRKIIVGRKAEEIFEKAPSQYKIVRPLRKGVICDFDDCKGLLKTALSDVTKRLFRKPGILISAPLDITPIEKAAFKDILCDIGFSKIEMIPEPSAALAGLVPDFHKKKGLLVVDVGAGITEAVVFSMGGIVCNATTRVGGEDFEHAITSYIKKRFNFEIGLPVAFFLLSLIGEDHPDSYLQAIEIKGISVPKRAPAILKIEMPDITKALDECFHVILRTVLKVLESIPEELSADIIENGIYLTGGASQYRRLIDILQLETGLGVNADAQPLLGVARGEIALLRDSKLRAICVEK